MIDNNLKFCREDMDMTQKELGYVFGVHETTVSGWETGKDTIPLSKLVKFCNLYNYSADYALGLSRQNKVLSDIPKLDKISLGKNLKSWRKRNKLNQATIARECMISQTTYSNYEMGKFLISSFALYTICKNHKLSMDEVLGRKVK